MGWFRNAPTANRIQNSATIVACAALLQGNQTVLEGVEQFSGDQVQRGNRLSAQAFSIQGASSSLGLQIQQAVGELNSFKREAGELNAQLNDCSAFFMGLVRQFSVPRADRSLNMSGKQMTELAANVTAESLSNLFQLAERREDVVARSVSTIDRADQALNPHTYTRASLALPGMEFRNS